MTAVTMVSVVGVLMLPGVRRHEPKVDASNWPTNEALTVRPIAATSIEPARPLEANENLVVVSRPAMAKQLASSEPPAAAATNAANVTATTNDTANEPAPATRVETKPVTMTGCLEADRERLLLKNATGAAAPKSRSWKSGFLKKQSASIELVEPTHVLKLASYDGQRVSVSGTLDDREMHVHSVQRVEASCR
jgi:hypothetical protein